MLDFAYSNSDVISSSAAVQTGATGLSATQRQHILKRHSVRVIGEGKPPMLLCNGFGCNQRIWQHLTTALAVRYQVIVFDYVGSGASELGAYDPHKYATLGGYAQDVVEICQALDLREAVIVGHSAGATIAMLAASQAPHHFAKTVLLAPSPYYLNEPGYYGGFERADMLQVLAMMDEDYRGWTTTFADLLIGPTHALSLGEELAGFFCETDSTIAKQFARVAFLSDNRADVAKLQLPTLLVQCTDDVAGPPEVGAYLLEHLPQAQLITLQTSGHCPHLSAPLETLAAIQSFVG
ncbi:alpha/beta fold hydrolase [Hymenobacter sp. BT559]|uniref:alpha/beta fold hydrolase n=1 Tax=Hymenobacter sp. BT559 TaxID=2795729 RepID=UPI0018ED0276|nr:alpha/beta hydrolase [Hymenobacter sp. BT559]MBJ6145520.1 alpha/beta hydrolase [Hymenobacter sp. BT559]